MQEGRREEIGFDQIRMTIGDGLVPSALSVCHHRDEEQLHEHPKFVNFINNIVRQELDWTQ